MVFCPSFSLLGCFSSLCRGVWCGRKKYEVEKCFLYSQIHQNNFIYCFHLISLLRSRNRISHASILSICVFVSVQVLQPYRITEKTKHTSNRCLSVMYIFFDVFLYVALIIILKGSNLYVSLYLGN